jgi:hypothetical protein
MSDVRAATRFVYGIEDLADFERNVSQTVQDIAKLGLEPSVSVSHIANHLGVFHLLAVVTGVGRKES